MIHRKTPHALKAGALGFLDAAVMAVAGSAPGYSITATTAALIAAAGTAGPAALCLGFLPMLGIALAFSHLNKWRPDAGAAYVWVGRSINPELGFLAGWALLSLSTTFMVAAALPAGEATLELIAPGRVHDVAFATGAGVVWFLAVLALVTCGITASARAQVAMTSLEILALLLIGVFAVWNARAAPVTPFSWSWFSPSAFGAFPVFAASMLVSIFYFFGWDVASNLAEETADADRTAGFSGVAGVLVIFALFLLAQVAVQMSLTPDVIEANAADLLPALGRAAFGEKGRAIAVLAVMVSAVATIETQLLQTTRLLFSMARDNVIAEPLGRLHSRFQTPWVAGFAVGGVSLLLFAAAAAAPTVNQLMGDLISAIGVQVAFYYALAGAACFWFYRPVLRDNWTTLVFAGLVPLASAIFVAFIGLYQLPALGWRVSAMAVGAILIGAAPMWYYRKLYRSTFYSAPLERAGASPDR
ncbi:APC family permease [Methylocapsa palsarum]|uniref:Amino acid transporter n=1 Tax=Methylocapsa palsarum TaxID=1612308 RepID=A0A1I4AE10_9HYPH|nr:APC family permease [Methylocapsa palsarum]SFK54307.1 Amino acid transporter [Methylocapsa palsarum]